MAIGFFLNLKNPVVGFASPRFFFRQVAKIRQKIKTLDQGSLFFG
jgi:hypothetical protein